MSDGTQKEIEAEAGTSLMELSVDNNIEEIEGACGGAMACATCHLYIHPEWQNKVCEQDNEKTDEEEDMLDLGFDVRDCSRLGCQITLTDALDGIIVALPGSNVDW